MASPEAAQAATKGSNRRRWSRIPAGSLPNVKTTLKSGAEVELIDVSRSGAQFLTPNRLLPGLSVTLCLVTSDGQLKVEGKVRRSKMVQLKSGKLGYEVGIAFDLLLMGMTGPPAPVEEPASEEVVDPDLTLAPMEPVEVAEPVRAAASRRPRPFAMTAAMPEESLDSLIGMLELK